jgi:hypothetical protein
VRAPVRRKGGRVGVRQPEGYSIHVIHRNGGPVPVAFRKEVDVVVLGRLVRELGVRVPLNAARRPATNRRDARALGCFTRVRRGSMTYGRLPPRSPRTAAPARPSAPPPLVESAASWSGGLIQRLPRGSTAYDPLAPRAPRTLAQARPSVPPRWRSIFSSKDEPVLARCALRFRPTPAW